MKPFEIFSQQQQTWTNFCETTHVREPSAVCLSTMGENGVPSSRMVLLKAWDERGFVFYTNAQSRKGKHLLENPNAAMLFYWDGLEQQIRIEGKVEHTSVDESDSYWHSRSVDSRHASAASAQSQVLNYYGEYEDRVAKLKESYGDEGPPRPKHWHGFRLVPTYFEFWEGARHRMHTRTCYELKNGVWHRFMLYP